MSAAQCPPPFCDLPPATAHTPKAWPRVAWPTPQKYAMNPDFCSQRCLYNNKRRKESLYDVTFKIFAGERKCSGRQRKILRRSAFDVRSSQGVAPIYDKILIVTPSGVRLNFATHEIARSSVWKIVPHRLSHSSREPSPRGRGVAETGSQARLSQPEFHAPARNDRIARRHSSP